MLNKEKSISREMPTLKKGDKWQHFKQFLGCSYPDHHILVKENGAPNVEKGTLAKDLTNDLSV